ncbi:MAG: histidine kinase dimerization/phosphoacceptor domain -containing protein [bacterium]
MPDSTHDSRFKDNPSVVGDPRLRFYMGIPIQSPEGFNIGVLCAFDPEPHKPSKNERRIFREQASMAEEQLQQKSELFPTLGDTRSADDIVHDLQHQVRNNFQVVLSVLSLERTKTSNNTARSICRHLEKRVGVITTLYDCLEKKRDTISVNVKHYINDLLYQIFQTQNPPSSITPDFEVDQIYMELERAALFGLLVNELVVNSLQHAFTENNEGTLKVIVESTPTGSSNNEHRLIVEDDGRGLPGGFDWRKDGSMGIKLIRNIGESKLSGNITLKNQNGCKFQLDFS